MVHALTIYTYGNIWINVNELMQLMRPYGINCVVDCRPSGFCSIAGNTPADLLRTELGRHDIIYLSFSSHFGVFPMDARNSHGTITYSKVRKTERFQQGIERLEEGIRKGYTICIIDNERETAKSHRFTLIGKCLSDRYNVMHINLNGQAFSQEQVEKSILSSKETRKIKVHKAQELGRAGEELTALYLSRNGYQILDRNWNLHRGCELDLVAIKDNRLHFIEVKTRTSDRFGEPQTAINWRKMRNMSKAIQTYRYRRALFNMEYQMDSVAILYRAEDDYDFKHYLGIRMDGGACDDVVSYVMRPSGVTDAGMTP